MKGPAGAKARQSARGLRQAETVAYRERDLTKEALDLFLERLDPNRERPNQEYHKLWRKLVVLWRPGGGTSQIYIGTS